MTLKEKSDDELICEMDQNLEYCVAFRFKDEILRRLALVPKWKDISEAPKDGTKIIGADFEKGYTAIIAYNGVEWEQQGITNGIGIGFYPTHFMPFPELPTKKH